MEFEKRVAIASGAVTEVGTLHQRAGSPNELPTFEQQGIQRRRPKGDIRERRHDAGGAVTVLTQLRGRGAASNRAPIGSELRTPGVSGQSARNDFGDVDAAIVSQQVPTAN